MTLAAPHQLPSGLSGELHQVCGEDAVIGGQGPDPELVVTTHSHQAQPGPGEAGDHVTCRLLPCLLRGGPPRPRE